MPKARPISDYLAYLLAQADRQINRQLDEEFRVEGVPVERARGVGSGDGRGGLADS